MITLYTSDTCGICRTIKMKLDKKGIPYTNEGNIDKLVELGVQRLPVMQFEDGTMIVSVTEMNNWINE